MNQYKQNLARTAVKIGVNLQKGQELFINSPIETAEFAREIAKAGFEAGAKDVHIHYGDENLAKLRYNNAAKETLMSIPAWVAGQYQEILDKDACVISIAAAEPGLMASVDPEKIAACTRAREAVSDVYSRAMMANNKRWCVISAPSEKWAAKVFTDTADPAQAQELLWSAIIRATHCAEKDPVACWHEQDQAFKTRSAILNNKQYKKLHYRNSLGTDFTVGMPENQNWSGGSECAQDGVVFFPNLPTEEIFCAPDRMTAEGTLVSSYPLIYNGQTIDGFRLTFKDGKVVDYSAETGEKVLKSLLESGENADRLGEIALVPYDSPISKMDLLFYNTLFDENASCHFALGAAYPSCITGGEKMSEEELTAAGLNQCRSHVDFMVGTRDLSIDGILPDGTEEPVFRDGNFVF
ncbi:MAG: aminopeptidase [Eubacteriaceae bacterium]|jgi:aminopeptidase